MAVMRVIEVPDVGVVRIDDAFCSNLSAEEQKTRTGECNNRIQRLCWEHTVRGHKQSNHMAGKTVTDGAK